MSCVVLKADAPLSCGGHSNIKFSKALSCSERVSCNALDERTGFDIVTQNSFEASSARAQKLLAG